MPEISRFPCIVIGMFYREHGPPHFHDVWGDHEATIDMESGATGRNSWRIGTARDRGSPWNASRRWSSDMDAVAEWC